MAEEGEEEATEEDEEIDFVEPEEAEEVDGGCWRQQCVLCGRV